MSYDKLRNRLKGPVYPVCPAFTEDFGFDADATARYADYLIANGAKTLMATAGTSRFNLLSDDEIKKLNSIVTKAGKGKAVTIAANQMIGSTEKAIEFAKDAKDCGADVILLYYPERYYNNDRTLKYYEDVASSTNIAMMIHAMPMRNAKAGPVKAVAYKPDLCVRLAEIDNVIGMKEESDDVVLRYKLARSLKDKMSLIIAGGSMRAFMSCMLYGIDGFLVGVGSFKPQIEEKFYEYMLKKEYDKALYIVDMLEKPFFDAAFNMGWHVAMKGAMSILGLMPEYERPPLTPADDSEMQQLKDVLDSILAVTDY